MRKHTGEKPYKCSFTDCNFAASTSASVKAHERGVHLDERPFKCILCDYASAQNSHLHTHMKTVHGNDRPFQCSYDDCKFAAKVKSELGTHIARVHGDKTFKCTFDGCDFSTTRKGSLESHMLIHENNFPFYCTVSGCDYKCKTRQALNVHADVHVEERTFKCDYPLCMHSFKSIRHLRHHQIVHQEARPYACTFPNCKYAAKTATLLKIHMRYHTGERPFKCEFPGCDFSSAKKCHINSHKKSMHSPEGIARHKRHEARIAKLLAANNLPMDSQVHIDFQCSNPSPETSVVDRPKKFALLDYVIQQPHATFILEVDEDQHCGYPVSCEIRRMMEVQASLMMGLQQQTAKPIVWIRYNPDGFRINDARVKVQDKERTASLLKILQNYQPKSQFEIIYMYYSAYSDSDNHLRPVIFDDPDYDKQVQSMVTRVITD